jgi:hypothetical protein
MTTHELAKKLLDGPDVPVCVNDKESRYSQEVADIFRYGGDWKHLDENGDVKQAEHIVIS